MVPIETIDVIIIISYSIICVIFLLTGIGFLLKAKDKPVQVRNYLLGIGLFFFLYGISRVLVFLFELTFEIDFIWNLSAADFERIFAERPDLELRHDIVWRLSTAIGTTGLVFLMYQLEVIIMKKKTKFLFTILTVVTVIPALILGVAGKDEVSIVRIILYAGNLLVIVIPLFYLYLAVKTSGTPRKRAIGAAFGMLLTFLGVVFNSSVGKTLFADQVYITYVLYGICSTLGIIIYWKSIQFD